MYVSIDMGGSKTRIASSANLETILKIKRFYTNKNPATQQQIISNGIKELSAPGVPEYVCMGVPGVVDRNNGTFIKLPNYKELDGKPFSSLLDTTAAPKYFIENDATLAAVGEAFLGAGKDYSRIGYLTFGTGTGGALVEKDGSGGFKYVGDEPGHTIIVEGGRLNSSCNHYGCLEAYTSVRSFEALFGIRPQDCTDKGVWAKYAEYINMGMQKLYPEWNCEVFIIGGSMAFEYPFFAEYLKAPVPVVRSLTLDDAGVYGGFILIKRILSGR